MAEDNSIKLSQNVVSSSGAPHLDESTNRRFHDLDALRGFAMLLGIGLHAALGFLPGLWPVKDITATWDGLYDDFLFAVHGFRMPVFFLMSGFFTTMMWRRRGLGYLISHRLRRVALPLVIGLITIVPLISWVSDQALRDQVSSGYGDDIFGMAFVGDLAGVEARLEGGEAGTVQVDGRNEPGGWTLLHVAAFTNNADLVELLLDRGAEPDMRAPGSFDETPFEIAVYYGHERVADRLARAGGGRGPAPGEAWSDLPGWADGAGYDQGGSDPDDWPQMYHLWFLWTLMWLVAGFVLVAYLSDRARSDLSSTGVWSGRIMWSMVLLTLLPQLQMGGGGMEPVFGPDTPDGLIPFPHVLAYYATFFTFGALLYGRSGPDGDPLIETVGRRWWLWLPVCIFFVFPAGLVFTFAVRFWLLASVLQVVYAWGMCLGLIGLFRRLLSRPIRGVRYLSDASYWLYITHLPLVIYIGMLVSDWKLPSVVKFGLISTSVLGILLVLYQLGVRYSPIGTLLNGRKTRPGRPITEL